MFVTVQGQYVDVLNMCSYFKL